MLQQLVIDRLFDSFKDLERAIGSAKRALGDKPEPPKEILERIDGYQNILDKQKSLATALCGYAKVRNWDEVARHVKLINGLSAMIRDDAREIVAGMQPNFSAPEKELMLS